mmetsp:Transcript_71722/g.140887  ORF Transcript_71722/g.140887 Transcript_71722/m.140887 type:complete len:156 (-) Transcript_71722:358-825(-)
MISDAQSDLIGALQKKHAVNKGTDIEILKGLSFILFDHRKLLESAVEMLGDDGQSTGVKEYVSNSCGRKFWKVRGSQDREYTCLRSFCSCQSYLIQTKQATTDVICKHLLAIKIADMMGLVEKEEVTDEKFVELMCQESSTNSVVSNKPFRSWRT